MKRIYRTKVQGGSEQRWPGRRKGKKDEKRASLSEKVCDKQKQNKNNIIKKEDR